MTLDRANTDREPIGNLPARGTAGYQPPDFVLALAERFDQRLPVRAHILRLAARAQQAAPKIKSDPVGGQRRRQLRDGSTGHTEALQVALGRRQPHGSFKRHPRLFAPALLLKDHRLQGQQPLSLLETCLRDLVFTVFPAQEGQSLAYHARQATIVQILDSLVAQHHRRRQTPLLIADAHQCTSDIPNIAGSPRALYDAPGGRLLADRGRPVLSPRATMSPCR